MSNPSSTPDNFTLLLRDFNNLVADNPPVQKIKEKLLNLKSEADKSPDLNYRQKDAIIARCDNYINGTYGKTKKPEHYEQGKPSK